jgi:hypothetical protein
MMKKTFMLAAIIAFGTSNIACHGDPQNGPGPSVKSTPATSPTVAPAGHKQDAWVGRWIGPEGTYLLLSGRGDRYEVKIQSLDGANTYEGVVAGDGIEFKRDGKVERIRAGSGKETGMKWLLEKTDCLIIKEGEGFCRK